MINITIPFTIKGRKYFIEFSEFENKLHDDVSTPIVDIQLISVNNQESNIDLKDLFFIRNKIKRFLDDNDVILYYYCDNSPITRRRELTSPQKYRNKLFTLLFKRGVNSSLIKEDVKFHDLDNTEHYFSFISYEKNKTDITKLVEYSNMAYAK